MLNFRSVFTYIHIYVAKGTKF